LSASYPARIFFTRWEIFIVDFLSDPICPLSDPVPGVYTESAV